MRQKNSILDWLAGAARAASAAALVMACWPGLAAADLSQTVNFNIAPQQLQEALIKYSAQSGVQVTSPSDLIEGKASEGVVGLLPAQGALAQLLRNTDLTYEVINSNTVTIHTMITASGGTGAASPTTANDKTLPLRLAQAESAPNGAAAATSNTGDSSRNQAEPDERTVLEEVVVISERRGRSLMNTSTSVVVLDAAALEQRAGLDGAKDLLGRIPNITATGTSNFAPAVRGVDGTGPAQGADAFLAGTRPRLNLQVDGRPANYNEVVFGDVGMWDVQQVEVLRGPQSALQGRNAVAGTLAVKTKDPTYETEGSLRVVGGNYQNREYAAAFSAPLVDEQLAFRVAAQRKTSESFVHMTPFEGVSDPREFKATTLRGKLLFEPKALAGFSTLLTLNYAEVRGPQGESVDEPFEDHVSSVTSMPVFQPRTTSAILASTWERSENLSFASTVAYTDFNVKRFAPVGTGIANIDGEQWVIEPTLRFRGMDGRVSGLGGVYYFHSSQDEFLDLITGGTFDDSTQTAAAFGELTYAFSEKFDVTLGARYEEEQRRRAGSLFIFVIDLDETYKVFLPKLVLSWHPSETLTIGTVAGRGYNGGGAGFTYEPPFVAYTFEPEYVWNYEVFMRSTLAGGRVSLTANAFLSQYDDIQLPFNLSPLSTVIRNADEAETRGLELNARVQALPGLEIFGGIGLLDTEVKKYPASGIEGNALPRSPKLSGDFGFAYTHPRGIEASFDARYSSSYYSDVLSDPLGRTDPYWIANAQLAYRFSHTRVFGYVSNVFDDHDALLIFPGLVDAANIIRPRTYGVGVQLSF